MLKFIDTLGYVLAATIGVAIIGMGLMWLDQYIATESVIAGLWFSIVLVYITLGVSKGRGGSW